MSRRAGQTIRQGTAGVVDNLVRRAELLGEARRPVTRTIRARCATRAARPSTAPTDSTRPAHFPGPPTSAPGSACANPAHLSKTSNLKQPVESLADHMHCRLTLAHGCLQRGLSLSASRRPVLWTQHGASHYSHRPGRDSASTPSRNSKNTANAAARPVRVAGRASRNTLPK